MAKEKETAFGLTTDEDNWLVITMYAGHEFNIFGFRALDGDPYGPGPWAEEPGQISIPPGVFTLEMDAGPRVGDRLEMSWDGVHVTNLTDGWRAPITSNFELEVLPDGSEPNEIN